MFKPITETRVLQVIAKLVNSKATGLDGIPKRALKCCGEVITPSLTFIFNFSAITKMFPDDLKVAKVAPVFKKGKRDDLGNYRPISVLPTVARVFEKLIFVTNSLSTLQKMDYLGMNSMDLGHCIQLP